MNDEEGLKEKVKEFEWPSDLAFVKTQAITSETAIVVEDIDDDLERELAFYNQVIFQHRSVRNCLSGRFCCETRHPRNGTEQNSVAEAGRLLCRNG